MIIYMIIKMLMSIFVLKTKIIKLETLNLIFDITILIIFIDLVFIIDIKQNEQIIYLLKMFIIYSLIFIMYNLANYILKNRVELINKFDVSTRERIKKIFMRPIIYKIVYYFIWILPWNIMYYIYFWWVENSWYLQVWISSTRDIIIWKLFKWDSRKYFYDVKEKMLENKIYKIIRYVYNRIRISIYRIILLLYYIRKNFLKTTIKEYIRNRIIIFMYLSIYYNYFINEIQHINKMLFYVLILIEIIILLFLGEIIKYFIVNYKEIFVKIIETLNIMFYFDWISDPIENYTLVNEPYIIKNTIWDITLSNSVSLNILYNWMIYVNKNTEGYYYYNMKIRTSILKHKLNEYTKESIIWDILPRTRYVIISLRYNYVNFDHIPNKDIIDNEIYKNRKHNEFLKQIELETEKGKDKRFFIRRPNFRIEEKKNLYLNFFEKTYNGDSSLLFLIWVLRNNFAFYDFNLKTMNCLSEKIYYGDDNVLLFQVYFEYTYWFKIWIYFKCLLKINKENKNLLSDELLLRICGTKYKYNIRDLESFILNNIFNNINFDLTNSKKIPENYVGIKNYKKMFELMGYMTLFEEEGIIWNNDLQNTLTIFNNEIYRDNNELKDFIMEFKNNISDYYYYYWDENLWEVNIDNCEENYNNILIECLIDWYGLEFNKSNEEMLELENLSKKNVEDIKIIDYGIINNKENDELDWLKIVHYILSKISKENYKNYNADDITFMTEKEKQEIIKKYK